MVSKSLSISPLARRPLSAKILSSPILILLFMVAANTSVSAQVAKQSPELLKRYSGTYQMGVDGQSMSKNADKYVLTPDGKCTWTIINLDKKIIHKGSWSANEGLIHIHIEDMEATGEGDELLEDFTLDKGVFRNEHVFLKKVTASAAKSPGK